MLPDQIFKHLAAFQQLAKVDEKVVRDRDLKRLGGSNLRCIFEAGSEGLGAAGTFNGFLWAEQPLSSEGLTKESKNWGPGEEAGRQVLHCGSERVDVRDGKGQQYPVPN